MAQHSLSADDIVLGFSSCDTSSALLLPSHSSQMESTTSTRQPADGAPNTPPPSITSSTSSTSSSFTIYSGPGDAQGVDQHTRSAIRDSMVTALHIRKTIKRLSFMVAVIFLLLGLTCLVTAGLTLVIPQRADSAVAQQMSNTLFTMLNIAGVLCIVQGVSWSSKCSTNHRQDSDNSVHQYPMWSRTPFMMMNRGSVNNQQGTGQTGTTSL